GTGPEPDGARPAAPLHVGLLVPRVARDHPGRLLAAAVLARASLRSLRGDGGPLSVRGLTIGRPVADASPAHAGPRWSVLPAAPRGKALAVASTRPGRHRPPVRRPRGLVGSAAPDRRSRAYGMGRISHRVTDRRRKRPGVLRVGLRGLRAVPSP